jgi:uncharacterized membrane protein (UPF0127 family)
MRSLLLLGAGLLAACQPDPQAAPTNVSPPAPAVSAVSGLPLVPLEVRSGGRTHRFTVEVARTQDEQAYGLMNRAQLGPNEGMIFPFSPPRPASFWMKNTIIPLDMLFIRANGSVARIAANAEPLSLKPVGVGEPVLAVLEIPGGRAAELGLDESARVTWPGGPRL